MECLENTNNRGRVLVIDDEGVVGVSCQRILTQIGYHVECQQDPKVGLETAVKGNYDVILLDLVMPELDGIEVLKRIKSNNVTSEVVIVTGYSTVQTAVEAMKIGAADYISKPFTPEELQATVQRVFEQSITAKECADRRANGIITEKGPEGEISTDQQAPEKWDELKQIKGELRDVAVRDIERRFVVDALKRAEGNVSRAAEQVGMQRTNFHALMRKYGLTSKDL